MARRQISDESRLKATDTRQKRSVFNRYIKSLGGKRAADRAARVAWIDAMLERGTKERRVPKFVDGKRRGTHLKEVPLLPAARAKYLGIRRRLAVVQPSGNSLELRAEFLAVLPGYATSQRWDREILEAVGVPPADLDAAGIE